MRQLMITFCLVVFTVAGFSHTFAGDEQYKLGQDSQVQPGVPQGTMTEYLWETSQVFPETKHRYSVYVPAQYDPQSKELPALAVFQDGHAYAGRGGQFRVPNVIDNLIASGEMPVTIAVFIDPGFLAHQSLPEKRGWNPKPANRSKEYDTLSEDYARFLETEILPEVAKTVRFTDDPNQRVICGISSGGICAFTVAWERPDLFANVISHVGSFTNIRGGHVYPAVIRKTEKKPIRIYLQDGSGDLDNRHGNWPLANQQMAAALKFSGYDYQFEYGTGGHNGIHGGVLLPAAFRWVFQQSGK